MTEHQRPNFVERLTHLYAELFGLWTASNDITVVAGERHNWPAAKLGFEVPVAADIEAIGVD